MAKSPPFKALKSWDLASLLGDPVASEQFFTPKGGLDLSPKRQAAAREVFVTNLAKEYEGQFRPFSGSQLPDWANSPWLEVDPVSSKVKAKSGLKQTWKEMGFSDSEIKAMQDRMSDKLGAFRGRGETYVEGLSKNDLPASLQGPKPAEGSPEEISQRLQENKQALFAEVAKALQGATTDEQKEAVVRAAFGRSGNAEQLFNEFGQWTDAEGQRILEQERQKRASGGGLKGAFSNLLDALDVPGDIALSGLQSVANLLPKFDIGVLKNEPVRNAQGREIGVEDLLAALKEAPKAVANIGTLGLASKLPGLQMDQAHDVSFEDIEPGVRALQESGHQDQRLLGEVLGLAGNVASDPLSYVTLGAGPLGKASATELLRAGVQRALPEELGQEAALAASRNVANIYRGGNFVGAARAAEKLGLDLDEIFPRLGVGRQGAAATQVRGGLTLRAGIPGTGVKGAVNVVAGRRLPSHVASALLDQMGAAGDFVRDPFELVTKLSRTGLSGWFKRQFPVESQVIESVEREARGHESRAVDPLIAASNNAEKRLQKLARSAKMSDDDLHETLNDLIELGPEGVHWTELVARVGSRQAQEFLNEATTLRDALQHMRATAVQLNVPVPELAAQAEGQIQYLPHGKEYQSQRESIRARAGIKPARVGPTKQRKITVGGGITNPATGEFYPTPKGTLNQINRVNSLIFGRPLYEANPFQQIRAYGYSMGKAIHGNHISNRLIEEGLGTELSDQIAKRYSNVGVIEDAEQAKAAYLAPLTEARGQAAATLAAKDQAERALAAARTYARETEGRTLQAVADLHTLRVATDASSDRVRVLTQDATAKDALRKEATAFQAHEEGILNARLNAELQDLHEAGAVPEVIRATTERYEAFRRQVRSDFDTIRRDLQTAPGGLRKRLEAHLRGLTPEVAAALRGASGRPYATILRDAVDTQKAIVHVDTIQRYGHGNLYALLSDADTGTEFGRESRHAALLAQQLGELDRRVANETRAGRYEVAANLQAQRDAMQQEADNLAERFATEPSFTEGVQRVMSIMDDPQVARFVQEAQSRVPVADLLAEQRGLVATGDAKGAARLGEHIAAVRQLGARMEIATRYEDVQRATRELAELGLRPDKASGELARSLKQHLAASLQELDELGRTGRTTASPRRVRQELQARYLREVDEQATIFTDDWRQARDELDSEITNHASLQEQVRQQEAEIHGLVAQQTLKAADVRKAEEALDTVTQDNIDALAKVAAQPTLIEHTVASLQDLAMVVEKLPYTNKTLAVPEDIARAIGNIANRERATGRFTGSLAWATNAIKRGILAVPASSGRRMFGELIQASFYAGMDPNELKLGFKYAAAARAATNLEEAPRELPFLRGGLEQNISEGKRIDIEAGLQRGTTTAFGGRVPRPGRMYQEALFTANTRWEDALRWGVFVHAKNMGMPDVAARAYVGKYLFFADELSTLERQVLSTSIMFWNFLRNNTQLQLYMLFHTPGKIAAYQDLTESIGQDVETPFGPTDVLEQGGVVLPFRGKGGGQEVLYPGLFDIPAGLTAIPDVAELGLGVGRKLAGQPAALGGGNEALMNVNPVLQAIISNLTNTNLATGQQYGERAEPYAPFGVEVGHFTGGQRAFFNALIPELRQFESISAATPGRKEAVVENLLSQLVGPTVRPITERTQGYEAADIVATLRALNKGTTNAKGEPLRIEDIRGNARKRREQQALDEAYYRLGIVPERGVAKVPPVRR